jgi:hypothetical protein
MVLGPTCYIKVQVIRHFLDRSSKVPSLQPAERRNTIAIAMVKTLVAIECAGFPIDEAKPIFPATLGARMMLAIKDFDGNSSQYSQDFWPSLDSVTFQCIHIKHFYFFSPYAELTNYPPNMANFSLRHRITVVITFRKTKGQPGGIVLQA